MKKLLIFALPIVLLAACTTQSPQSTPTPTTDISYIIQNTTQPIIPDDWKSYTNTDLGISFLYPTEYGDPKLTNNELISFTSPLESNRPVKAQEGLLATELKVEIYIVKNYSKSVEDAAKEADSQSEELSTRFDTKEWRTLAGQKAYYRKGSGLGTFENFIVVANNKSYTIAKYPAETSRQAEFDTFLKSINFK